MKRALLVIALIGSVSASVGATGPNLWAYPISYPEGRIWIAAALNDKGQVVGEVIDSNGVGKAFYTGPNGVGTYLLDLPSDEAIAFSINNSGQIVGGAVSGNSWSAFATDPNGLNPRLLDDSNLDMAYKITNDGTVLAYSLDKSEYYVAYLDGRAAAKVKIDGAYPGAQVDDMNNRGQLSGWAVKKPGDGSLRQAFVTGPNGRGTKWIDAVEGATPQYLVINDSGDGVGALTKYGPKGAFSEAVEVKRRNSEPRIIAAPMDGSSGLNAINSGGLVGGSSDPNGRDRHSRALVGKFGGEIADLNALVMNMPLGVLLDSTIAINNRGQILARAYYSSAYYLVCPSEKCE